MSVTSIRRSVPNELLWLITLLLVLLFLGILHLAAVREMRADVECRDEDQYLLTESGDYITTEKGERITLEEKEKRCKLVIANSVFPLPSLVEIKHILNDEFSTLRIMIISARKSH